MWPCLPYLYFTDAWQVVSTGRLGAQFDPQGKIDILDLATNEHNELVPRTKLVQSAQGSPDMKQSPNATKNAKRASQQRQKQQLQIPQDQSPQTSVPKSLLTDLGTTADVSRVLEVENPTCNLSKRPY